MIPEHKDLKVVLIDATTPASVIRKWAEGLQKAEVVGFDIETQDRNRHAGLNVYNNKKRTVFDHRRTVITGFSTYVEGDDTAYYVNMAHADVANRMPEGFGNNALDLINDDAIMVCHNAPFELVMVKQAWGYDLKNVVCTLQMAVSHHGPDDYDLKTFYAEPLPTAFWKFGKQIVEKFADYTPGDALTGTQQELLLKFISKTSTSAHSYNGFVKSIAKGYGLKRLTKSQFGFDQTSFYDVVGDGDMGSVTGPQVVAYGADDAYWAVRHYRHMFDDMLENDPRALRAFFSQENPMIHVYADAWREGIRLDLNQVFERRDIERKEMATLLRRLKARIREALPFNDDLHAKLAEKQPFYAARGAKKRADIVRWANSKDEDDDFKQCFQVANPIGDAWAKEKGLAVPKGKLNIGFWETMRVIMYDLLELPIQYDEGSVASDADARGRIREKLDKDSLQGQIMSDLQDMADIEQRMKLYLTPYTQLMDPETSHVYPSLSSQLATRRLATSFPNPMQLAKTGNSAYIRSFYLGDSPDHLVISADWSAIELVLIGDMSNGRSFRTVYGQVPYGDMHTGSAVDGLSVKWMPGLTEEEFREFKFGRNPNGRNLVDFSGRVLSPKDFHKWARGTAIGKGINFGYWYSGAVSTVANNLGLSSAEHWELVDKYRSRHPDEEAWRVALQQEATARGYVELPDGHRRNRFEVTGDFQYAMTHKFSEMSLSPGMKNYGQLAARRIAARGRNQVVNAMIQGTCATLAKRSILNLKKAVAEAGLEWGYMKDCRLLMPIHDEVVFSVHKDAVMRFIPLLRAAMETHPDIVQNLPLNCTVAVGRTFRPFDAKNPAMSQIELDEAQSIEGIVPKELEGTKLSDTKVGELIDWMYHVD